MSGCEQILSIFKTCAIYSQGYVGKTNMPTGNYG